MHFLMLMVPLFLMLGLSLIFPILIIAKWKKRPVIAQTIATVVCFLSLSIIFLLAAITSGSTDRLSSGLFGMAALTLIFGFPVLALLQWRARKKQKQEIQTEINEAF